MAITDQDVNKIAKLAALQLSEADIPTYAGNINNILELVEQMSSVDTDAIKPMAHPFDASTRLRDDAVSEEDQRDALLAIAPATESGLYLVPKVIEE